MNICVEFWPKNKKPNPGLLPSFFLTFFIERRVSAGVSG